MKLIKLFEDYDNLYELITKGYKPVKVRGSNLTYRDVETDDFALRYAIEPDHITLMWINVKNKENIQGYKIFEVLLRIAKEKNIFITAYGCKGKIRAGKELIESTGYRAMLRWGIIPDKGLPFINKALGENFKNFYEAFASENFWKRWEKNGREFSGEFHLDSELSWNLFNRKI